MQRDKYDRVAIALHWIIAAIMIFMIFFGEELMEKAKDPFQPSLHVSLGTTVLVLTVFRLI